MIEKLAVDGHRISVNCNTCGKMLEYINNKHAYCRECKNRFEAKSPWFRCLVIITIQR